MLYFLSEKGEKGCVQHTPSYAAKVLSFKIIKQLFHSFNNLL